MYYYQLEFENGDPLNISLPDKFNPFTTLWIKLDGGDWVNTSFVKRVVLIEYRGDEAWWRMNLKN